MYGLSSLNFQVDGGPSKYMYSMDYYDYTVKIGDYNISMYVEVIHYQTIGKVLDMKCLGKVNRVYQMCILVSTLCDVFYCDIIQKIP